MNMLPSCGLSELKGSTFHDTGGWLLSATMLTSMWTPAAPGHPQRLSVGANAMVIIWGAMLLTHGNFFGWKMQLTYARGRFWARFHLIRGVDATGANRRTGRRLLVPMDRAAHQFIASRED
jgi:hypothetical protein